MIPKGCVSIVLREERSENMRRFLSFFAAVLLCFCFASPALAAKDSFVPSIGYKDGPDIVDGEMEDEDVVGCLLVTSIQEAEEKSTDIHQEDRDLLLEVYAQLVDGSMKLPLESDDYVIRELVDVSFSVPCDDQHIHEERLKEEGITVEVTFDLGIEPDVRIIVMAYVDEEWIPVPVINKGDGTVECEFEEICPVVFCVEDSRPPAQTGDVAGRQLILWIVLMAVSAVAVVVLVLCRKKFVH